MKRIYYDEDATTAALKDETVAVLGYGSQGHAQAQNLRDSGIKVVVGLRPQSSSWNQVKADGLTPLPTAEACKQAGVIQVLVPDEVQPAVYEASIAANLETGNALAFSHGFNIHFNQIKPPADVDVFMIAPKAPGHRFRELFVQGQGVPGLLAVHQDATGQAQQRALAYAKAVGCTRAGVIETSFQEETETDLFGEQAVLCGGVTSLIKAGFETLVEAGYQPEVAYFECLHEMKLIVDLMYKQGLAGMRYSISDTAQYGDITRGPRVIDEHNKTAMREILAEIQSGEFASEWIQENQAGRPVFNARTRADDDHPLEATGRRLRERIRWFHEEDEYEQASNG